MLSRWFNRRGWSDIVISVPYAWLLIFFLIPFLIVVGMSFATRTSTAPPFGFGGENPLFNLNGYARLFTDTLYIRAFVTSLVNAAVAHAVIDSVAEGTVPKDMVEDLLSIASVFIHWEAMDRKMVNENNLQATRSATARAFGREPGIDEIIGESNCKVFLLRTARWRRSLT